jgi:hypothetical protein
MEHQYVLDEYQKKFKNPKIVTYDQLMLFIGMNKSVGKWYSELKADTSTLLLMPDSYIEAGMTVEQWNDLAVERSIAKTAGSVHSSEIAVAAGIFATSMEKANKKRSLELAKVGMIVRLTKLTINELPMTCQTELALVEDSKVRKALGKEMIASYQAEYVAILLSGGQLESDPFA